MTEDERIKAAELRYARVLHILDAEERASVARQRKMREEGKTNQYGHDLSAAISRAKFREDQREALRFLVETCRGNIFAAMSKITRAYFDMDETPRSGESQPERLKRALESELRDVDREYARAEKRRSDGS